MKGKPATVCTGNEYPLAYVVLAHGAWSTLADLIKVIAADPFDTVVVHVDRKSDWRQRKALEEHFSSRRNVIIFSEVRCKWGGISLVDATVCALKRLRDSGRRYEYVSLLSGTDYPIKPLSELRVLLSLCGHLEFIEARNFYTERWVKTGIYVERLEYWFPFARSGWLSRPFKIWYHLMRTLDRRTLPIEGFVAYSGSQWWTLSQAFIEWVLANPKTAEIRTRMKSAFIPDEMFFQTLLMNSPYLAKAAFRNLRYIEWLPSGTPRFLNLDDFEKIKHSPEFFCRKIVRPGGSDLTAKIEVELLSRDTNRGSDLVPRRKGAS